MIIFGKKILCKSTKRFDWSALFHLLAIKSGPKRDDETSSLATQKN